LRAKAARLGIDVVRERQNAVTADEPQRLDAERGEGGEIKEREQPQEKPGDELVSRRLELAAPEEAADSEGALAALRDEGVGELGYEREAREITIELEPEAFAACMAERGKAGLGVARELSVRRDVLDAALEGIERDLRILRRDVLVA